MSIEADVNLDEFLRDEAEDHFLESDQEEVKMLREQLENEDGEINETVMANLYRFLGDVGEEDDNLIERINKKYKSVKQEFERARKEEVAERASRFENVVIDEEGARVEPLEIPEYSKEEFIDKFASAIKPERPKPRADFQEELDMAVSANMYAGGDDGKALLVQIAYHETGYAIMMKTQVDPVEGDDGLFTDERDQFADFYDQNDVLSEEPESDLPDEVVKREEPEEAEYRDLTEYAEEEHGIGVKVMDDPSASDEELERFLFERCYFAYSAEGNDVEEEEFSRMLMQKVEDFDTVYSDLQAVKDPDPVQ